MRILIVNYRYFISGGPEKYMFNIKQILEEHGHEVIPFSVHSNRNLATKYEKYFVEPIGGRDATYYEDYKKTPRVIWKMFTRSIYSFEVKRALQREIQEIKPDLVYIIHFVNKLSPSVIRGAKQMGVPVVLRLSDYFLLCPRFDFLYKRHICEDCLTKGYRSCIQKRCIKGSFFASTIRVLSMKVHKLIRVYEDVDAFITPSEFLRSKLIQYGFPKENIYCIPSFATGNNELQDDDKLGSYGLYFGRISEEKGVEFVVQAYEKLPDHLLKIVGDDTTEEANKIKKYIHKKGLNNIEFLGFKNGNELKQIIKEARFSIVPSIWYDNLPNTALESFQQAKPVIASNIGSLPELVEDNYNGLLFQPGNVNELVDRIKQLDDANMVRRLGRNSYNLLNSRFSSSNHYKALLSVFERCREPIRH